MGLIEMVAIATIVSGFASALGIGIALHNAKTTKNNIQKQTKVSSASLVLKFLDTLREDKFKQLWREIRNPDIKEYDSKILSPYLNTFEEIAVFTKEETLQLDHVMEFYGANLKSVRDDKFIQEYIKCKFEESDGFSFAKLKWLLEQVQKYGV